MSIQKHLDNYLALRRSLGFKLVRAGMWLPHFVHEVEKSQRALVTSQLAIRWAQGTKNPPPKSWVSRHSMARHFTQYLHAQDSRHELLPIELSPCTAHLALKPYIYSDNDIRNLMNELRMFSGILRGHTYSTLVGLLASTGMRVGEVIALNRLDFDVHQGLIQIHKSKFGKSRQIPLHPTTVKALVEYAKIRDSGVLKPISPAFFISSTGRRVIYVNFQFVFHKIVKVLRLGMSTSQSPRIHDLRHTFAVKTITSWYKAGLDTGPKLPTLSTYLGHVSPSSTYTYLHATPELLQQAKCRLEKSQSRGSKS